MLVGVASLPPEHMHFTAETGKLRKHLQHSVPDYIRGGFTGNNSVTPNYPLSHLTPSFDDFAVEIAAKGNKSSPIHFLF